MSRVGYRYSIAWNNPYTQPPDGKPRVVLAVDVPPDWSTRHGPPAIKVMVFTLRLPTRPFSTGATSDASSIAASAWHCGSAGNARCSRRR